MLKANKTMMSMRLAPDSIKSLKILSDELGISQSELVELLIRSLKYHREHDYAERKEEVAIDGLHGSFNRVLAMCRMVQEYKKNKKEEAE